MSVRVPVVPTKEMINAGGEAFLIARDRTDTNEWTDAGNIYKSMIAAAPAATQEQPSLATTDAPRGAVPATVADLPLTRDEVIEQMSTETPRTDAVAYAPLTSYPDELVVSVDDARQLERELAAAHAARELVASVVKQLARLINCNSLENASNTPDYILAQFLESCLLAYNTAIQQRETWYGRDARPTEPVNEAAVQANEPVGDENA